MNVLARLKSKGLSRGALHNFYCHRIIFLQENRSDWGTAKAKSGQSRHDDSRRLSSCGLDNDGPTSAVATSLIQ